ncbi:MAG: Periplasmic serine protease [Candidatus Alkanophagales archaeon MCA70_species_1]|nr:Periplasmic serine protease [Candidatus Alkanophaga volatiphilum]
MTNGIELVDVETDPEICEKFQEEMDERTAALAMIAPYLPAKVSPSKALWAEIGLVEELNMEDTIYKLKENNITNLILVINSFGGGVSSSFKIAYALRKNFDDITVFVPHIAASGGTLIALVGNEIVMGDMSTLTPIDVQMERNGKMYSVNAMIRSFSALNDLFKDTAEEDAPYPWKAMANKLDPVEFQEWIDASSLMELHAEKILEMNKSFKDNKDGIINRLTSGYPVHSYTITVEEAKEIFGDHIHHGDEEEYKKLWEASRLWVKKYINVESSNHIIRFILPKKEKEDVKK